MINPGGFCMPKNRRFVPPYYMTPQDEDGNYMFDEFSTYEDAEWRAKTFRESGVLTQYEFEIFVDQIAKHRFIVKARLKYSSW